MRMKAKKILKWIVLGREYAEIPSDLIAQIFRYIVFLLCLAAIFGFLLMFAVGMSKTNVLANTPMVAGKARVIDGDTLYIDTYKIRLSGIDAPEIAQTCQTDTGRSYACGKMATQYLQQVIGTRSVSCHVSGKDKYSRLLGTCYADGIHLNMHMIKNGWAVPYYTYGFSSILNGIYAYIHNNGMWAGSFQLPSTYRKSKQKQGDKK